MVGRPKLNRTPDPNIAQPMAPQAPNAASAPTPTPTADQPAASKTPSDRFTKERSENPAAFLSEQNTSESSFRERLQQKSTQELSGVVQGLDQSSLGFGENVSEAGWSALRNEVDDRFAAASKEQRFVDPDLAGLSLASVRQGQFGDRSLSAEQGWRQVALPMAQLKAQSGAPEQKTGLKSLELAQRLSQHRTAGSTPPALLSNKQLLDRVSNIPKMMGGADLLSLTGLGSFTAGPMAQAKSGELLSELEHRFSNGQIPRFEPRTQAPERLSMATSLLEAGAWLQPGRLLNKGLPKILGAAQRPKHKYRRNPDGARTPDQAAALLEKHGVELPENAKIMYLDEKTAAQHLPPGIPATYFQFKPNSPDQLIRWKDFENKQGQIPVKVRSSVLQSDEELVATLAHEAHELMELEAIFKDRLALPARELARLINDRKDGGRPGNLHEEAWDIANELIDEIRGTNKRP